MPTLKTFVAGAKNKAKITLQNAIHHATPIVKREIHKTVSSSAADIQDKIFTVLMVGGMIYACYNMGKPATDAVSDISTIARGFNMNYNEVKVESLTYNIYLGGNE